MLTASSHAWSSDALKFDPLTSPAVPSLNVNRYLMNAVALAGTRVAAAGERGLIMLSDDGGAHWRQAHSVPVSVTLNRLFFVNEQVGWAVGHGGIVLGTRDGGETWTVLLDGLRAAQLESDAAGADSGNTQRKASAKRMVADGPDKPFFDVYFRDAMHGIVVGAYGMLFATEDGGEHWSSGMNRFGAPIERHLYSIQMVGHDLYITGEQGLLYQSKDGGKEFRAVAIPAKGTLFGLASTEAGHILVYGLRGAIFRLDPGGREWTKIDVPPITFTTGLRLKDGALALANEAGQVFRSTDNGASFALVTQAQASPVVAMKELGEGSLVLAGIRNLRVLAIDKNKVESKK